MIKSKQITTGKDGQLGSFATRMWPESCIIRSCNKIDLNQRCQPFTGFDSLQRACASLSPDGIASLVLPPMDNAARAACSKSAGASELGEKSA